MLAFELPSFPLLHTQRLVLRQLRSSDAERVFAMRSDPRVMQHVSRPLAMSLDDAVALIEKITNSVAALEAVQWAITLKERDELIGMIGFWRMAKEHHRAELGYMLAKEQWGRGVISEAIAAVLHFGFEQLGLHKVEAITRPVNRASIRALEKNGFTLEGHLRDDILCNGVYEDSLYFGKLAE